MHSDYCYFSYRETYHSAIQIFLCHFIHGFLSAHGARVCPCMSCRAPGTPAVSCRPVFRAHGAVVPLSTDGGAGVLEAQGALVGWFGPDGAGG